MTSYPGEYGDVKKSARELNPEELQHLFNKLSSDETKELQDMMRKCTSEITMTRGVPLTAAILGSLYFARTRLPAQYHFGPKGWPFYAIVGIGSLTVSNLFFMGTCKERITPKIEELWQKYQLEDNKKMTYDYIRQQHRSGNVVPETQYTSPAETTYTTLRHENRGESSPDNFIYNMPQDNSFSSYGQPRQEDVVVPPRRSYNYQPYQEESFMSGTPSGSSRPREREFS